MIVPIKGASLSRAMSRFHDCILAMRAVNFHRVAFPERLPLDDP